MRKFFSCLVLGALLMAGGARAEGEVAFVDMNEVFKQFYKTKLANDQIRQQADDVRREREAMEEEIKVMQAEVEALRADSRDAELSVELRANKRDQLEEKLVELQKKEKDMADYEKLRREQMSQQNARMSKKIFDEIHASVITFSKEKGYAAVIDSSAQGTRGTLNVLYVSPQVNITADVLAVLNEGREGTLKTGSRYDVESDGGE